MRTANSGRRAGATKRSGPAALPFSPTKPGGATFAESEIPPSGLVHQSPGRRCGPAISTRRRWNSCCAAKARRRQQAAGWHCFEARPLGRSECLPVRTRLNKQEVMRGGQVLPLARPSPQGSCASARPAAPALPLSRRSAKRRGGGVFEKKILAGERRCTAPEQSIGSRQEASCLHLPFTASLPFLA